jgi:glycosyltransferase involved in cell wall biosynthesis
MRILHIAPVKAVIENGSISLAIEGISNSVTRLIKSQSENGHSVGLFSSFDCTGVIPNDIFYKHIPHINLYTIFHNPLKTLIQDFGSPDVIHVHDIYNIKQLFVVFFALNLGLKVYISPRGCFSQVALQRSRVKKTIFRIIFNPLIIWRSYGFVALNLGEKKQIEKLYPNKKIIVAPNGVNNNFQIHKNNFKNFKKKFHLKTINIGFLGRFDIHIKGLDLLLKAYLKYQINTNDINIKLTFIGEHRAKDEWDSKVLFNDIESNLPNPSMLSILGPKFGKDKWSELSKIDILIQPSRTEGMPMTVLEAMSIGIPCIVTRETNMEEIINDSRAGWVIDANEDDLFKIFFEVENIQKIRLAKLGWNGMRYVKKKLTWRKVSKLDY